MEHNNVCRFSLIKSGYFKSIRFLIFYVSERPISFLRKWQLKAKVINVDRNNIQLFNLMKSGHLIAECLLSDYHFCLPVQVHTAIPRHGRAREKSCFSVITTKQNKVQLYSLVKFRYYRLSLIKLLRFMPLFQSTLTCQLKGECYC